MGVHFVRASQVNLSDHHNPERNNDLNRQPHKGLFANALNHHKQPAKYLGAPAHRNCYRRLLMCLYQLIRLPRTTAIQRVAQRSFNRRIGLFTHSFTSIQVVAIAFRLANPRRGFGEIPCTIQHAITSHPLSPFHCLL